MIDKFFYLFFGMLDKYATWVDEAFIEWPDEKKKKKKK